MAKREKIKINYTKKDLLTWEQIEDFCMDNEMLTLFVDDFSRLFRENFYLSDEETREYLSMIIANCSEKKVEQISSIVQSLADFDKELKEYFEDSKGLLALIYQPHIFQELGEEPLSGKTALERKQEILQRIENFTDEQKAKFLKRLGRINVDERRQEARKMFRKLIDFSLNSSSDDKTALPKDFFPILKQAKLLGIDPTKWVTSTNLRHMTAYKFNDMIHGLIGQQYDNPFYKEGGDQPKTFCLFTHEDLPELLQASTLISMFRPGAVQPLIDLIGNTLKAYDGAKIEDLVKVFKTFSTILTCSPIEISKNIDALEERCVGPDRLTKAQFAQEIIRKPSILQCDPKKIAEFEMLYTMILDELVDENITTADHDSVLKQVEKVCYDFRQLDKINALRSEQIYQLGHIKDVLVKQVGAENALVLMGDFNILNANPSYIDYIFSAAKLIQSSNKSGKDLVKYIASNTAQFFGNLEENDPIEKLKSVLPDGKTEKRPRTATRKAILPQEDSEMPTTQDIDSAFDRLSKEEKAKAKATVEALIEFAKSEPERPKNSFERAAAISDEEIEELMRLAEIECIDDNDPVIEIITRFKIIFEEQNSIGSSRRITDFDEFIEGYKTFRDYVRSIDLDGLCQYVHQLQLCKTFLDAAAYDPSIEPGLDSILQYLNENKEKVGGIMYATFIDNMPGFDVTKDMLKHIRFENFHSKPSKMDVVTCVIVSRIIKYVDAYFPDRKEKILPQKLLDRFYTYESLDNKFLEISTATRTLFLALSDLITADESKRINPNALKAFNTIANPVSLPTIEHRRDGFSVRHDANGKILPFARYFCNMKKLKEILTHSQQAYVDYVTDNGFIVDSFLVPSTDSSAAKDLELIGIPTKPLEKAVITRSVGQKDELDYALSSDFSNSIVEYLKRNDRSLIDGDGSGKK